MIPPIPCLGKTGRVTSEAAAEIEAAAVAEISATEIVAARIGVRRVLPGILIGHRLVCFSGLRCPGSEQAADGTAQQQSPGDAQGRLRGAGKEAVGTAIPGAPLAPGRHMVGRTRRFPATVEIAVAPLHLLFEFGDPPLGDAQGMFLHEDRLGHVVRSARLPRDFLADQRLGLGVARIGTALDVAKPRKQTFDGTAIFRVQHQFSPVSNNQALTWERSGGCTMVPDPVLGRGGRMEDTAKNVLRETDDEAVGLAKTLIRSADHAVIATLDPQTGRPIATRVGMATDADGAPLILVSALAAHTPALRADPRCSLLIGEPGKGDPLAHPRITLHCDAREIERGSAEEARVSERYLAHAPKAKLYAGLGDFRYFRLEPVAASLNAGFGKAYALNAADVLD
jgi:hypothetical protein